MSDSSHAVVECADLTLAITRDGQLFQGTRWLATESERCINKLFKLVGRRPGEGLED